MEGRGWRVDRSGRNVMDFVTTSNILMWLVGRGAVLK